MLIRLEIWVDSPSVGRNRPPSSRSPGSRWPAARLPLRLPLTMRRREGKPSRAANFRRTADRTSQVRPVRARVSRSPVSQEAALRTRWAAKPTPTCRISSRTRTAGAASHRAKSAAPAGRENPLEPSGVARTAQLPNQMVQNNAGRNPPAQGEPLDNDTLDERRTPRTRRRPAAASFICIKIRTLPAGRARAREWRARQGEPKLCWVARIARRRVTTRRLAASPRRPARSSHSVAHSPSGEPRPAAAGDDPFGGNRPGGATGSAERFSPSATAENPLAQPARATTSPGTVSPVGTTNDAGDYYVVQPQDNFWTISRKKYGNARYFQALAELNKSRIPDPSRMRPGMKVSTPPVEVLEEKYGQFLPAGTRVQTTAAEDMTAKSARQPDSSSAPMAPRNIARASTTRSPRSPPSIWDVRRAGFRFTR